MNAPRQRGRPPKEVTAAAESGASLKTPQLPTKSEFDKQHKKEEYQRLRLQGAFTIAAGVANSEFQKFGGFDDENDLAEHCLKISDAIIERAGNHGKKK